MIKVMFVCLRVCARTHAHCTAAHQLACLRTCCLFLLVRECVRLPILPRASTRARAHTHTRTGTRRSSVRSGGSRSVASGKSPRDGDNQSLQTLSVGGAYVFVLICGAEGFGMDA